ncbi:MAG TPA: ABC transporter ATP-binding protein [Spirochaetales bacterium]|nr:ABC transporter ATP-binding protein [Spirochaetales bacterium]HRY55771.1 ABC transporter ATP-binding protein [Spirochaetia bacterium]HRZ63350.1 ABC transporter ATP-binding protein [Spirochaetia bacterium]
MAAEAPLVSIRGLELGYPVRSGLFKRVVGSVRAVAGVDLDIRRGETLGLVGESGCGKTSLGKAMLQLERPTGGEVLLDCGGARRDLCRMRQGELREARRRMQIVFQDPYSSLNPAFTIYGSLEDAMRRYGLATRAERRRRLGELLEAVNMRPEHMDRYPSEFSGGQRQRIGIARALSADPELVVCDEAVSALDVSIRAQVLNLLLKLKAERGLTYLFISHDLSVVEYVSDRIAVMYLGRIVELAGTEELYSNPLHPYTRALLSAIPIADPDRARRRIVLEGDVPSPVDPPPGCPFHPRCPDRVEECSRVPPALRTHMIKGEAHAAACHLAKE